MSKTKTITDLLSELTELYTCPISKEPMKDPYLASNGFSYEQSEIEHLIKSGFREDLEGRKFDSFTFPNHSLKNVSEILENKLKPAFNDQMKGMEDLKEQIFRLEQKIINLRMR